MGDSFKPPPTKKVQKLKQTPLPPFLVGDLDESSREVENQVELKMAGEFSGETIGKTEAQGT